MNQCTNAQPSPTAHAAALRSLAQWHRTESQNIFTQSEAAMRLHERAAEALETEAKKIEGGQIQQQQDAAE